MENSKDHHNTSHQELNSFASLVSKKSARKKKSPKKTQDSEYWWKNTFSHTQKRQSKINFNGCVNPSWLAGVPGSSHRATGLCATLPMSQQKDFDPSSVKSGTLKTGIWLKCTDIHTSAEQRNTIEHETRKDISWISWQAPLYSCSLLGKEMFHAQRPLLLDGLNEDQQTVHRRVSFPIF